MKKVNIQELKEIQDAAWTALLNAQYKYKFTKHFVVTNSAFTESYEWQNHIDAAKVASDAWATYENARAKYNNAKEGTNES